jgi:hypothetical protein
MSWRLDGQPIDPDQLTFSEIGFGRPRGALRWSLSLPRDRFLALLAEIYAECVEELREDDALTGAFEPPHPGATDYPTLADFLDVPGPWFAEFFDTYFRLDLLRGLLVEDGAAPVLLQSLRIVRHDGDTVELDGTAARRSG